VKVVIINRRLTLTSGAARFSSFIGDIFLGRRWS